MNDVIQQALSLPYSIGSQRLLRELLAREAGIALPPDPEVRHGPVRPPKSLPRPRKPIKRAERLALVLGALRRGPVTLADVPELSDAWELTDAAAQLRRLGHRISNTQPKSKPARYIIDANSACKA